MLANVVLNMPYFRRTNIIYWVIATIYQKIIS